MQIYFIVKTRCFLILLLIHYQNQKKLAHYSWDIYQENLATKFSKVSWWALWVEDPRNFRNSFFVKTIVWTWFFFQVLQNALLQNEKKSIKKDESNLKVDWHCKRKKKKIEKEKEKRKMRKSQTTIIIIFLLLLFYLENFIFCYKRYLEKHVCIVTFVLQVFFVADYCKCSNKTPRPI